ncbi:MAG TPA: 30S ribosomal protein S16 [Patescibacteria group bacterium]|jgi:small subunit ribosomal protein S16|nr:30S ribosomal protein S16 [Patescibacteria group bacterium]
MLSIRLQRIGRKGLPIYRVAVQESRLHASSGRVVAYVGQYNPHTKATKLDADKIDFYLKNGAQPTSRVVRLMETEKISLPAWVTKASGNKKRDVRHPDKLKKNQVKEPVAAEALAEEPKAATNSESQAEA